MVVPPLFLLRQGKAFCSSPPPPLLKINRHKCLFPLLQRLQSERISHHSSAQHAWPAFAGPHRPS